LSPQRSKVRSVAKDLDLRLVIDIHFKGAAAWPSAAGDGCAAGNHIGVQRSENKKQNPRIEERLLFHD
jgi:hypothetical protein